MKRILFFSILAALLCGCNSANHEGQGSTTDTIGVDSVVNSVIAESEPSEPEPPFTSPDLKFHHAQGPVKQIVEKWKRNDGTTGSVTYNFDRQGKWTPDQRITLERNSKGQIISMKEQYDDEYDIDFYEYKYNKDGYVCQSEYIYESEEETFKYTLNENGWPVSTKTAFIDPTDDSTYGSGTQSYTYSDIDEQGNWMKCQMKVKENDGENNYAYSVTTTRKITYWE